MKNYVGCCSRNVRSICNLTEATEGLRAYEADLADIAREMEIDAHTEHFTTGCVIKKWLHKRIVMLTTFDQEAHVHQSLGTGVIGYLLKGARPDRLISAIRAAYDGFVSIEPSVAARLRKRARHDEQMQLERRFDLSQLSRRKQAFLTMLAAGHSNHEIAETLHLAEQTVKNYVRSI